MSVPTFLSGRAPGDGADVVLAKLGVVAALLLLSLQLFASQAFLLVIPLALGTGAGLYLLLHRREATEVARPTLPRRIAGFLPAVVVFGLAALVAVVHSLGGRTGGAYLLTGAIGGLIFGQILLVDREAVATGPVLFQILAAAVTIRLTALYATPGYVGVDIWTHATVFVDGIARSGSLAPLDESKYLLAPFYHVLGATGALVFGSVRNGIYLSIGLFVPLSALFIYATGALLIPTRWALLATALYAFSDQFIRWGMHIIPTSLGLAFFLAVVYLVTKLFRDDAERWVVALLVVCSLAVVFTHQVGTAITLFFLGTAAFVAVALQAVPGASGRPAGTRKAVALGGTFGVTLVTTLVSWANMPFSGGSTFLWRELAVIGSAVANDAGFLNLAGSDAPETVGAAPESALAQLVPYVELVGFGLLLAAAVVGGLLLLRWRVAPDIALTYLLAGGGLFVGVFGLSLFGIRVLLPGRWVAFLYVPMVLLGAVGLYHVSRNGSGRVILAVFVVLAVGYPTTMVVAEKATLDAPTFDDHHTRFAYTEAEIGAVDTIGGIEPPSETSSLATDHPYKTVFDRVGGYEPADLVLGGDGPTGTEATVYRDYQSTGPIAFRQAEGDPPTEAATNASDAVCPATWNKAYANDAVWLCTDPADESEAGE